MPQFSFSSIIAMVVEAFLIWSAVSMLLAVRRINKTWELTPNQFIYPASCKPEACKDPGGFIKFITPRLTFFAVACLILSLFLILQSLTNMFSFLPVWLTSRGSVLFFIPFFVWYVVIINKAAKAFW